MADLVIHVRDALCDREEIVRKAAGTCFATLLRAVGRRAIDDIVPALLWQLDEEEGDAYKSNLVLEGIKTVLSINSSDVLPFLIPAMVKPPLTLFHAQALAFLSSNFTKGFIRYVESVTQALLDGLGRAKPEELADMRVACAQVVLCVTQDCVSIFANTLEETSTTNKNPAVRAAVAHLISAFTSNTRTDFGSQVPLLLQILLRMFVEEGELLVAAWEALDAMMKSVPEDRQAKHISFVRSVLKDISIDQYTLAKRASIPAFDLKNGIKPLLPMFQYGLMHGSASLRVEAADGLSDLVQLTSEAALAPFTIKITGPLIRIVGDRFPADVKQAILNTLYLLLLKCNKVRAFTLCCLYKHACARNWPLAHMLLVCFVCRFTAYETVPASVADDFHQSPDGSVRCSASSCCLGVGGADHGAPSCRHGAQRVGHGGAERICGGGRQDQLLAGDGGHLH
jgi:hypothetical protein